jgi:hypothetical protein
MKRGLNQVLFQFTPGKTFDNTEDNAIEKVIQIKGDNIDNVDKQNLVNRIYQSSQQWEGGATGFLPPEEDNYEIVKPEAVISQVFPLVFRCKKCKKVHDYSNDRDELRGSNGVSCERDNCDGKLTQIHHVMVCGNCSEIQNLYVPYCNDHGRQYIQLDDRPDRYANFKWVCKICDETVREGVWGKCFNCDSNMEPTVHRASKAYRVHSLKRVDIDYHYSIDPDSQESREKSDVALGAYFGVFDHPHETIGDIMSLGGRESTKEEDLMEEEELGEEEIEALKRRAPNFFKDDNEKRNIIETSQSLQEDNGQMISQNLMNYLLTLEEIDIETLAESNVSVDESARDMMENRGIEEIRLTSELPILTAVYGYHRTFDDPENDDYPQMRAFPWLSSENDRKRPVYAKNTETEAVFVTLDPERVAEWLQENDLIDEEIEDKGREELKALIYNKMESIEPYDTVNEYSEVSVYVHRLLHTMSHQLMKSGSLLSGLEETSLAEFLFPEALTFAIYANQSQSYTAGGLYTLVDRDLDRWLKNAYREGQYCIYDPVCSNQGGSCHACTHIGEVGCQYFNQNLSRATLFGREAGTDDINGYWRE